MNAGGGLVVAGLVVTRGGRTVLDGVDLSVGAGRIVAVVGPSGAGKTTLLAVCAGWESHDRGEVRRPAGVVAVIPQGLALLPELTLRDNLVIAARGAGRAAAFDPKAFEAVEIGHLADRLPGEVSLGEQQRAAAARAGVVGPALVVADEPTAHQDARRAALVVDGLRRLADRGAAVLVASHDPAVVAGADAVVALDRGAIRHVAGSSPSS